MPAADTGLLSLQAQQAAAPLVLEDNASGCPALPRVACRRGELRCIGATTLDEYRQYIEKDPALER